MSFVVSNNEDNVSSISKIARSAGAATFRKSNASLFFICARIFEPKLLDIIGDSITIEEKKQDWKA